jgi:hypothetical protein
MQLIFECPFRWEEKCNFHEILEISSQSQSIYEYARMITESFLSHGHSNEILVSDLRDQRRCQAVDISNVEMLIDVIRNST